MPPLLAGVLLISALMVSCQEQKLGSPRRCQRHCRSSSDCCPPQVCSTRHWRPGVGYSRYGSCVTNKSPCRQPCGRGQWCGSRSTLFGEHAGHTCLKHSCLVNRHCPAGSICRKDKRGNCCFRVTCAKKCPAGQRCVGLPTACANLGPSPPPCYCPLAYTCRPCSGIWAVPGCSPPEPEPEPESRCNPPCPKNKRCGEATLPPGHPSFDLLPATKKYTCVQDACKHDFDCRPGSVCNKDARGNCCFPKTCAQKCPVGTRCEALYPPCANYGPNPPPCYCKPSYQCRPQASCRGASCKKQPIPILQSAGPAGV